MDVLVKETDRYYLEASSDLNQQPEAGGVFGSGKHIIFAPAPLEIGAWTHLAITYDGAMIRLYVDGAETANSPVTSPLTSSTAPLRIGGDAVYGQFFNGTIDEVRVYARALSADEIRGDMSAPLGTGAANPMPAASNIVPDTALAGGAGFTLTVSGSGFIPGSIVGWNGAERATTYVSGTVLHAEIPASDS